MDIFISISYIIKSLLKIQNITMRIYSVNHRIFFWNRYYILLQLNTYISVCINLINRNTLFSFRNTSGVPSILFPHCLLCLKYNIDYKPFYSISQTYSMTSVWQKLIWLYILTQYVIEIWMVNYNSFHICNSINLLLFGKLLSKILL